ncbi:hypothetical protein B0H14DRAFT_2700988 [Mycena olivaceomarginata]|nr:hypothetical protein B0H14DRAFT_2700988 [Mycena olivaceomarginata]
MRPGAAPCTMELAADLGEGLRRGDAEARRDYEGALLLRAPVARVRGRGGSRWAHASWRARACPFGGSWKWGAFSRGRQGTDGRWDGAYSVPLRFAIRTCLHPRGVYAGARSCRERGCDNGDGMDLSADAGAGVGVFALRTSLVCPFEDPHSPNTLRTRERPRTFPYVPTHLRLLRLVMLVVSCTYPIFFATPRRLTLTSPRGFESQFGNYLS